MFPCWCCFWRLFVKPLLITRLFFSFRLLSHAGYICSPKCFQKCPICRYFCHWSYICDLLLILILLFILKRSPACGQASKGRHVRSWFVLVVHLVLWSFRHWDILCVFNACVYVLVLHGYGLALGHHCDLSYSGHNIWVRSILTLSSEARAGLLP